MINQNHSNSSDSRNSTEPHIFKIKLTMKSIYPPPTSLNLVLSISKRIPLQVPRYQPHGLSDAIDLAIRHAIEHNFWDLHEIARAGGLDPTTLPNMGINIGVLFAGEDEEEAMASSETLMCEEIETAVAWCEKSGWRDYLSVHIEMAISEEKRDDLARKAELRAIDEEEKDWE